MTETASPALHTALAYYQAWTGHDLDKAMSYVADDIVCSYLHIEPEGLDTLIKVALEKLKAELRKR